MVILRTFLACLAVIASAQYCDPIPRLDPYPNCEACRRLVGDSRIAIESILLGFKALFTGQCHLKPATEDDCIFTTELIYNTATKVKDAFFPAQSEKNESRQVTCSHIIPVCPDMSKTGEKLDEKEWSCSSCSEILLSILKVIRAPIQEVNSQAGSFFCKEDDKPCKDAFNTAIKIQGSIGDILLNENLVDVVCRTVIKCVT